MIKAKPNCSGFTLIEVMITAAIIGILAAIAIPNFLGFRCKSLQSDAKTNLGAVFTAQESYFSVHNTYAVCDTMEDFKTKLGWYVVGESDYSYKTVSQETASFQGVADGWIGNKQDVWTINQRRQLSNFPNGCE